MDVGRKVRRLLPGFERVLVGRHVRLLLRSMQSPPQAADSAAPWNERAQSLLERIIDAHPDTQAAVWIGLAELLEQTIRGQPRGLRLALRTCLKALDASAAKLSALHGAGNSALHRRKAMTALAQAASAACLAKRMLRPIPAPDVAGWAAKHLPQLTAALIASAAAPAGLVVQPEHLAALRVHMTDLVQAGIAAGQQPSTPISVRDHLFSARGQLQQYFAQAQEPRQDEEPTRGRSSTLGAPHAPAAEAAKQCAGEALQGGVPSLDTCRSAVAAARGALEGLFQLPWGVLPPQVTSTLAAAGCKAPRASLGAPPGDTASQGRAGEGAAEGSDDDGWESDEEASAVTGTAAIPEGAEVYLASLADAAADLRVLHSWCEAWKRRLQASGGPSGAYLSESVTACAGALAQVQEAAASALAHAGWTAKLPPASWQPPPASDQQVVSQHPPPAPDTSVPSGPGAPALETSGRRGTKRRPPAPPFLRTLRAKARRIRRSM